MALSYKDLLNLINKAELALIALKQAPDKETAERIAAPILAEVSRALLPDGSSSTGSE